MKLARRIRTLWSLFAHFARPSRFFLLPLLVILLLTGALLAATSGLSYVAPFWYAIF
jgi:Family of unknown function (DUF5989)